jgi:hypothetical protein
MQSLPSTQHRAQPWKNGLGMSRLIADAPAGAGFDTVLGQVSATEVNADSPFSDLTGLDRTLTVLAGAGVELSSIDQASGATHRKVVQRLQPYVFAGDWRTDCRLLDGPVRVLNVMTRRGRFAATVDIRSGELSLKCGVEEVLVAVDLSSLDAWLLDEGVGVVPPRGSVAVVRLTGLPR